MLSLYLKHGNALSKKAVTENDSKNCFLSPAISCNVWSYVPWAEDLVAPFPRLPGHVPPMFCLPAIADPLASCAQSWTCFSLSSLILPDCDVSSVMWKFNYFWDLYPWDSFEFDWNWLRERSREGWRLLCWGHGLVTPASQSSHPSPPSLIAALGNWKLRTTCGLWQKSSKWITVFLANVVFASALCDPNGPKLTLSHCSLLTSLKLEGCYEDLSFGFFFSGLMEPRKERELLCPVGLMGASLPCWAGSVAAAQTLTRELLCTGPPWVYMQL